MPETTSAENAFQHPAQPVTRWPPGPRGWPLIGVLPQVQKDSLAFFVNAAREHGDVALIDFGLRKMVMVSHPDGMKRILQDNPRNYVKGYDNVKLFFGEGLVTSDGDFWLRQRRLIQPAFHKERVKGFAEVMTSEITALLEGWAVAHREGRSINLGIEGMRLALAVIVKTMFSPEGLTPDETVQVHADFNAAMEHFNRMVLSPVALPHWVPTPANRRFQRAVRRLEALVYRMIAQRRQASGPPSDLLSMLVQARDEETGAQMTDRQVRDEVMTIFLAGHETTGTTLAWAFYLLSMHPEVARRLEAEVDQVLGGRVPTAEDVPRLTYTRMVVDETLRLYPAGWMFARVAVNEDEVCGYRVSPGTNLMLSPYVVHRRADLWPNPEAFDPDRFAPDAQGRRHKFAYMPFSGGPRVCIGNSFSLMESVLLLAMTAQRYRLHLVPGRPVRVQPTSTLRPQPGVFMTVVPRA